MVGEVEHLEPTVMEIIWTDPRRPNATVGVRGDGGRVASAGGATRATGTVGGAQIDNIASQRKYKGASGTIKGQFRRAEQREAGSL